MSGVVVGLSQDKSQQDERKTLALKLVELTRSQLIASAPFLASATGALHPQIAQIPSALATDGTALLINPDVLLAEFAHTRKLPVQTYAHTLLHCIFLHPFVGEIEQALWSLAADMICWVLSEEIFFKRGIAPKASAGLPTSRNQTERSLDDQRRLDVMRLLSSQMSGTLTTERLYHVLSRGENSDQIAAWSRLFFVDSHQLWKTEEAPDDQQQEGGSNSKGSTDNSRTSSATNQQSTPHALPTPDEDSSESSDERDETAPQINQPQLSDARLSSAENSQKTWEHIAQQLRVDLETLSRKQGSSLQTLIGALRVSSHQQKDYREFLRQFAVENEDVRLSDDEFDYVFYTYGLELYGDMPLIEPLEYRQENRVRDFAIIIDTSSSVTKKVVQEFIDATYDVLTTEGGFFKQSCIHIIQADLRVQSDVRISSAADLANWRNHIELRGLGGTDFRPAIQYVRQLWQQGEFTDLRGLLYFTDGWGIYPPQAPPFKCAFVFYDEDHRPDIVPSWAEQLVLHPGEFESLSVYDKRRR